MNKKDEDDEFFELVTSGDSVSDLDDLLASRRQRLINLCVKRNGFSVRFATITVDRMISWLLGKDDNDKQ